MKVKPIGVIHSPFRQATGTPIQPCFARGVEGRVEVFKEFVPGLRDLAGFERIWLLYWFDRTVIETPGLLVKPYLDSARRGVFATRAPARPNPIGLSAVRLRKIRDNTLTICDVDILNGTPLLDIKPYVPKFDSFSVARMGWLKGAMAKRTVADNRFEKKSR
ncbi:MAG: tRNA (N6-threonylcarbamoyladenosine(37)-N6)-methyltransferase TrmO [Terriglobia bacterium]|jgi:tRNA-Thr(GGU) m(6)t(6)A37 methyltransferase TsaA